MISLSDIKQARDHMAGLLSIKRFCALVVPIKHEVKAKGSKHDRTQKKETGAYLVRLFEGGSIRISVTIGEELANSINAQLAPITREALRPHREVLIKAARKPPGIESLRDLEEGLKHLEAANSFGVVYSDPVIQPSNSIEAYVYFDGQGAKDRAEDYCVTVNSILTKAFAERTTTLTKALADAVSGL